MPFGHRGVVPATPDGPFVGADRGLAGGSSGRGRHPARFEAQGLWYSIDQKDGHVIHTETRRDAAGRIIAENAAEVRYVLGSGKQAMGFLIDHDGYLFESPVTFYIRERRWGLSPGYEK